jgi:hypothetical protein
MSALQDGHMMPTARPAVAVKVVDLGVGFPPLHAMLAAVPREGELLALAGRDYRVVRVIHEIGADLHAITLSVQAVSAGG